MTSVTHISFARLALNVLQDIRCKLANLAYVCSILLYSHRRLQLQLTLQTLYGLVIHLPAFLANYFSYAAMIPIASPVLVKDRTNP